jgi:hypothetical protein
MKRTERLLRNDINDVLHRVELRRNVPSLRAKSRTAGTADFPPSTP